MLKLELKRIFFEEIKCACRWSDGDIGSGV